VNRPAEHVAARPAVAADVADGEQARHRRAPQARAFSNRRSCDASGTVTVTG
jgi:hypothetical protein